MRIAITGATGNVGTALVRALAADPDVEAIVGVARRVPRWQPPKTTWVQADVARHDLRPVFAGADVVVHLAWLIQPSRATGVTDAVNIEGSRRVFDAAVDAGVPALIHASSVAAYSPAVGPVHEAWSTTGIPGAYYSRQKVAVERLLDDVEARSPGLRVARMRPGLIFQRSAASEIRRYFGGPFVPGWLLRPSWIPAIPDLPGLAGQIVHADDVAQAYRLLCRSPSAAGAFNVAADPPLTGRSVATLLDAQAVRLPRGPVRALVAASWRARLHPVSPDWLDIATSVPVMSTARARRELGWVPRHASGEVLLEFLDGLHAGASFDTPPLARHAGGRGRVRELTSGVGGPNRLDRASARGAPRGESPSGQASK